jgi:hypothetical protein
VVVFAAVGLWSVIATAAAQASTQPWSIVAGAKSSAKESELGGVSCLSDAFCASVGVSANSYTAQRVDTLFESWNGTGWLAMPGNGTSLEGEPIDLSCASKTFCVAVGEDVASASEGEGLKPLIESWNGTRWSKMQGPTGSGVESLLTGVSCASEDFCVAVGSEVPSTTSSKTTEKPLIESWNGNTWTASPSPATGQHVALLTGVSCVSVKFCTAVGADGLLTTKKLKIEALIESFDGKSWSTTPNPDSSANPSELVSVSCGSQSACAAVGLGETGSLIESWNGSRWANDTSPGKSSVEFSAVSCVVSSGPPDCTAAGSRGSTTLTEAPALNTTATASSLPPEAICLGFLVPATCEIANAPSASSETTAIAETRNGRTWSLETSANVKGTQSLLVGVSCFAPVTDPRCSAVGVSAKATSRTETVASLIEMNFS